MFLSLMGSNACGAFLFTVVIFGNLTDHHDFLKANGLDNTNQALLLFIKLCNQGDQSLWGGERGEHSPPDRIEKNFSFFCGRNFLKLSIFKS